MWNGKNHCGYIIFCIHVKFSPLLLHFQQLTGYWTELIDRYFIVLRKKFTPRTNWQLRKRKTFLKTTQPEQLMTECLSSQLRLSKLWTIKAASSIFPEPPGTNGERAGACWRVADALLTQRMSPDVSAFISSLRPKAELIVPFKTRHIFSLKFTSRLINFYYIFFVTPPSGHRPSLSEPRVVQGRGERLCWLTNRIHSSDVHWCDGKRRKRPVRL